MDTLTININPNTIRLLSAISSSVQSSLTTDKNPDICETVSKVKSMKGVSLDHSDEKSLTEFWKPIQLNELNMPYLGLTSGKLLFYSFITIVIVIINIEYLNP